MMTAFKTAIREQGASAIVESANQAIVDPVTDGPFPGLSFGREVLQCEAVKRKEFAGLLDSIIKDIHTGTQTDVGTIEQVVAYAIRQMMPKSKKANETGAKWVHQAASIDKMRAVINWSIYDKAHDCTIAVDGRRLHLVAGYQFAIPGKYAWDGADYKTEEEFSRVGTFPNYRQVIPDIGREDRLINIEDLGAIETGKDAVHDYELTWCDGEKRRVGFNGRFIVEMLNGSTAPEYFLKRNTTDKGEVLTPLKVVDGNRIGLVMPFRIK